MNKKLSSMGVPVPADRAEWLNKAQAIDGMTREQWLALRAAGIGGTAAAAICGCSSFQSRFEAYAAIVDGREIEQTIQMEVGIALEPWILTKLEQHLQVQTARGLFARHPHHDWMVGSLDAVILDAEGRAIAGADAKSTDFFMREDWGSKDEPIVPEGYEIQGRWYMAITDLPRWYFPVLIGKNELRFAQVERDLDTEGQMIQMVERFWFDHILPRNPPPIDWTDAARDHLRARFPESSKRIRPATKAETVDAYKWKRLRQDLAAIERAEATAKNRVIQIIGGDDGIKIGGEKVSYNHDNNRLTAPRSWKGK